MWRALKVAPASVPSNSKGLKQTSYQRASSFVQRESLPTMVRCSGTSHGRHPWREHHIVLYIQSWCSFLISFEKDLLKMSSRVRSYGRGFGLHCAFARAFRDSAAQSNLCPSQM